MNMKLEIPLAPPNIRTPDLENDIIDFFCPEISIQDYRENYEPEDSNIKFKLQLVTERFEFINHLLALKELLEQNKKSKSLTIKIERKELTINDDIEFHGREYNGVDYDIEALCFYLLLTCIDTIVGDRNKVGKNFKTAITQIPEELKNRVCSHFAIVEFQNDIFSDKIITEWKNHESKQIDEFADYLYYVRNNFTHNSLKSYIPRYPADRLKLDIKKKIPLSLVPLETDTLLKLIEDIVIDLVKKKLLPKRDENHV